jgi:hypothetical protein
LERLKKKLKKPNLVRSTYKESYTHIFHDQLHHFT